MDHLLNLGAVDKIVEICIVPFRISCLASDKMNNLGTIHRHFHINLQVDDSSKCVDFESGTYGAGYKF